MIGPLGRGIATVSLVSVAFGVSACGGGSSTPPAPQFVQQPASVELMPAAPPAFVCHSKPCIYVTNGVGPSMTVYRAVANGDVSPIHTIAGSDTDLSQPNGIAVDGDYEVYVANLEGGSQSTGSITVYAAGAHGNVFAARTITGSNTLLSYPVGVGLDANNNTYVANVSGSVTVYAAGANGNVPPIRNISGPNTGMLCPAGVVVDRRGKTYVANFTGSCTSAIGDGSYGTVTVYAAGANGNVAPIATIFGSNTGLDGPLGIALGETGKLNVVNSINNSVTVYAAGANGNAAPLQTVMGSRTGLANPYGIAVRGSAMFVANESSNSVTVYRADANGNVAPIRTISGANTSFNDPRGIAVR